MDGRSLNLAARIFLDFFFICWCTEQEAASGEFLLEGKLQTQRILKHFGVNKLKHVKTSFCERNLLVLDLQCCLH